MDLEQKAIARLRLAAEMSETYYGQPLVLTTSGGKDSDVCLYLAAASGIHYEVMHSHTSVDAAFLSTVDAFRPPHAGHDHAAYATALFQN